MTFETLTTILTIENLNSWQSLFLTINCDTGQHSQFLRCLVFDPHCEDDDLGKGAISDGWSTTVHCGSIRGRMGLDHRAGWGIDYRAPREYGDVGITKWFTICPTCYLCAGLPRPCKSEGLGDSLWQCKMSLWDAASVVLGKAPAKGADWVTYLTGYTSAQDKGSGAKIMFGCWIVEISRRTAYYVKRIWRTHSRLKKASLWNSNPTSSWKSGGGSQNLEVNVKMKYDINRIKIFQDIYSRVISPSARIKHWQCN